MNYLCGEVVHRTLDGELSAHLVRVRRPPADGGLRSTISSEPSYQAEAGLPIWPYHYHHGIEEWLYVIAGAPVLRDPALSTTGLPANVRYPDTGIG